jgi:hypothetical protein
MSKRKKHLHLSFTSKVLKQYVESQGENNVKSV